MILKTLRIGIDIPNDSHSDSIGEGSGLTTLVFLCHQGKEQKLNQIVSNGTKRTHGIRSHLLRQDSPRRHHSAVWKASRGHSNSDIVQRSSHPEEGRCQATETSRTPRRTRQCSRARRRTSSSLGCTGGNRRTGTGAHCRSEAEASLGLRERHCRKKGRQCCPLILCPIMWRTGSRFLSGK